MSIRCWYRCISKHTVSIFTILRVQTKKKSCASRHVIFAFIVSPAIAWNDYVNTTAKTLRPKRDYHALMLTTVKLTSNALLTRNAQHGAKGAVKNSSLSTTSSPDAYLCPLGAFEFYFPQVLSLSSNSPYCIAFFGNYYCTHMLCDSKALVLCHSSVIYSNAYATSYMSSPFANWV